MPATSQVIIETITSEVLRDNPLGDPPTRRVPVYLPPGYADTQARYPVVYLLTGFTGRGTFLLNDSTFDENIQERMDRLIAKGEVQPMILVMPDGFTRYGGSQYLNSSATGRYEDHLIEELVPFIDGHYRTRAEAGYRAIAGKSSGGYGAIVQAMRHPVHRSRPVPVRLRHDPAAERFGWLQQALRESRRRCRHQRRQ